jgi:hypothetical protein
MMAGVMMASMMMDGVVFGKCHASPQALKSLSQARLTRLTRP